MKTIYRKVKTTLIDLPDYEGYYDTDVGNIYYNGEHWVTNEGRNDSFEFPSWYLKEIKFPTEEEIEVEATRMLRDHWYNKDAASKMTDNEIIKQFFLEWCLACDVTKNVLSKLK